MSGLFSTSENEVESLYMEVDTGAVVSVIAEEVYRQKLSCVQENHRLYKSYSGHKLDTVGEIEVNVVYGKVTKRLPLVVIQGNGYALLGHNWMSKIWLDWFAIKQVQEENCGNH